jgi:tetraacyldisaccharide 4'-kinase
LFFTSIKYGEPYHIISRKEYRLDKNTEVLLVAGIANPLPLKKMLEENSKAYFLSHFPDHHIFTIDDLKEIKKRYEKVEATQKIILTTEKDAMRLIKFREVLHDLPMYVIPIRHHFLFNKAEAFNVIVTNFIENFKREE